MRTENGGYRRDHLRALGQRIEVDKKELRIMGSKGALLRTLVAVSSVKTAGFGVPSSVPKWRPYQIRTGVAAVRGAAAMGSTAVHRISSGNRQRPFP